MSDTLLLSGVGGPHAGQPVLYTEPTGDARGTLILIHGRHATAEGMLPLVRALALEEWKVVAPQASEGTWYPHSFLAPLEQNEPHLSSALDFLDAIVETVAGNGGDEARIALLGFSQGACLALEYAARSTRAIGGVIGLSGGLIGPTGTEFTYSGSRVGLEVLLGCSDVDPHIPLSRVHETERVLSELGAEVSVNIYAGMGHTISTDELSRSRDLLSRMSPRSRGEQ